MKLKPLGDRVIVKAIDQDQVTASGLVLPDTAKERPQRGKVLAVGEGRWGDDGARVALGKFHGDDLSLVVAAARADREDLAALRLLLRGVGQDDPARRRFLFLEDLDDEAISQRL